MAKSIKILVKEQLKLLSVTILRESIFFRKVSWKHKGHFYIKILNSQKFKVNLVFVISFQSDLNTHLSVPNDAEPKALKYDVDGRGLDDVEVSGVIGKGHNVSIHLNLLALPELNAGSVDRDLQVAKTGDITITATVDKLSHDAELTFNLLQKVMYQNKLIPCVINTLLTYFEAVINSLSNTMKRLKVQGGFE